jgi:multidrug efflux pump
MDQAKEIRLMVADLENNIITGLILVVVVLLFALGLRNALLVGLAIPFSMLLSFSVLQALGITLNMVVLFSLTLALGMLVDNAIVIVENIYRYMEQGVPRLHRGGHEGHRRGGLAGDRLHHDHPGGLLPLDLLDRPDG